MGGFPQTVPPKFKFFILLRQMHENFEVSNYKEKIKFDKIWGYQNGGPSQTWLKNSNFLTTNARHMEFSE